MLTDELAVIAGAAFTRRLDSPAVLPGQQCAERLVHPEVGELRLVAEQLALSDADDQRLVVQLPADDATSAALGRLAGRRPGALRAVSG